MLYTALSLCITPARRDSLSLDGAVRALAQATGFPPAALHTRATHRPGRWLVLDSDLIVGAVIERSLV
jgi:hypothetical protein